jgi:hypothetical protein
MRKLSALALALVGCGAAAVAAFAAPGAVTGPSSSQAPYVIRSQPGVVTKAIITTGDAAANGYRMVGIPDGLGAYDNGNGTFTVLMNHELGNTVGITRAHGSKGAFVSKWVIDKTDLSVVSGQDLSQTVFLWQNGSYVAGTTPWNRLCSADLPAPSAFYNASSGKGYNGRIFMDGEEAGAEGRAFGHLTTGASYQLPSLGRFSWENSVANPGTGDRTVVAGTDDAGGGQVYFYYGDKTTTGNAIDQAGLSGGNLYGLKVNGLVNETDATVVADGTPFTLANLGDVSGKSGATLQTDSVAAGVSGFQRPEDGSWDPSNPNVFYFVTTAGITNQSRLWRLTFNDPADPAAGGTIDELVSGSEGHKMFDNITVNDRGQVLLQEDVGNNPRLGKLWLYDRASDSLTEIAHHDENRFAPGTPNFITEDEESSGIIPAPFLGEGKYLFDVQNHLASADPELVEGGQLLVLQVPPGKSPH